MTSPEVHQNCTRCGHFKSDAELVTPVGRCAVNKRSITADEKAVCPAKDLKP